MLPPAAHEFHNRLRVLLGIDRHELVAAGALADDDFAGWVAFATDPFREFIRGSDAKAAAIWSIVEKRSTRSAS